MLGEFRLARLDGGDAGFQLLQLALHFLELGLRFCKHLLERCNLGIVASHLRLLDRHVQLFDTGLGLGDAVGELLALFFHGVEASRLLLEIGVLLVKLGLAASVFLFART